MMRSRSLRILTVVSLVPISSAFTIPALLQRDDVPVCATTSASSPCPAGIRFCCPAASTCFLATADQDTVLCCPQGQSCAIIKPISCDLQQQNATLFPNSYVQTVDFSQTLQQCGTSCCPSGYTCKGGTCFASSSSPPSSAPSSPQSTPAVPIMTNPSTSAPGASFSATTSTPSSTSSPATMVLATSTPQPASMPEVHSNPLPAGAVFLGLFLGLVFGALIMLFALWYWRRHRAKKLAQKGQDSSSSFMGRTPVPLQQEAPGPSYVPYTPAVPKEKEITISKPVPNTISSLPEPMWTNSDLQPLAPPSHRTDFLLRRGSCETGYENAVKPTWSVKKSKLSEQSPVDNSERGRRKRVQKLAISRPMEPRTPPNQTAPARFSKEMATRPGRRPLFAKPLKLDLANKASAAAEQRPAPARPPRSDELVPSVGGSHMRNDSQSRGLLSRENLGHTRRPDDLSRTNSDASALSETPMRDPREASGETINVIMTPAEASSRSDRRDTTFSELMRKAGWKKGLDGRY